MYESGILRVKDLFDNNNLPLEYEYFKQKFPLQCCPFTVYYGILAAIPRHWKDNLEFRNGDKTSRENRLEKLQNVQSASRFIYNELINVIFTPPVCKMKWNESFQFSESQWRVIFRIPQLACREV